MVVSRVTRTWDPQRYGRFQLERLRPALDLLGQIPIMEPNKTTSPPVQRIVDLGCGTGNITSFLRKRWPEARILCLDASKEMLDEARSNHAAQGLTDDRHLQYAQADLESFTVREGAPRMDIIFSNSALHWVSFDVHRILLSHYMSLLNPGGVLAFQMPDTRAQNSHLMMKQAMIDLGFASKNVRWVTTEVDPDQYYDLLAPKCTHLNIWTSTYYHQLQGDNPVADFTASTGLGPYVDALGGATITDGQQFISRYRELIREKYPKQADGTSLYGMKRFFVVAQK